jgi:hypothetical protein
LPICNLSDSANVVAKFIRARGIDVNAQNADGDTAAIAAAAHGHEWMIEQLALIPGFQANAKNTRGKTVADIVRPLAELAIRADRPFGGRGIQRREEG